MIGMAQCSKTLLDYRKVSVFELDHHIEL